MAVAVRATMKTLHIALLIGLLTPIVGCTLDLDRAAGWQSIAEQTEDWQPLIAGELVAEAHGQTSYCVHKTLTRNIYVSSFAAVAAWQDHELSLSIGPPSGLDATTSCSKLGSQATTIYTSRAGAAPLRLPANVAMKLDAGQQLRLFVRAVNTSEQTAVSRATVRIETLGAQQVKSLAEAIVVGPAQLTIPSGVVAATGRCALSHDSFLFGVAPHVRPFGESLFAVAYSSFSGEVVLHEGEGRGAHSLSQPVPMRAGEVVEVSCDYQSGSNHTLQMDPSDLDRRCFATVYLFPAAPEGNFMCDEK